MGNGVIICIDDERVVLNGLQSQLGRFMGDLYEIELAESGEEALDLVRELLHAGKHIPIVISDQLMPGIKGHEVLTQIHLVSPGTYTVLLTGHSDMQAISEAVNHANLYRYITKPWDGQDLTLTVREAIRGYYQDRKLEEQNRQLELHNKELEKRVYERTRDLLREKEKSDALLLNILPDEVAMELREKGEAHPQYYEQVSVLFTDFQSFTQTASNINPQQLVQTLNECFTAFDEIIGRHNLEKIKTIGDAYMCAGGLPVKNTSNPLDAVRAGLEIRDWVHAWNDQREAQGLKRWEIRIGVNTGDLIAGVIGKKKFAYDVWGDAVNTAARMESSGQIGKVNISPSTYACIKGHFACEHRGALPVKGKEIMDMYFVLAPLPAEAVAAAAAQNGADETPENRIDFEGMKAYILGRLRNELPPELFYHGVHHTLDVHARAAEIAAQESLSPIQNLLLETAALYHDCGYIHSAFRHEEIGCEIARASLPGFGYTAAQIQEICGMIMATQIPQTPLNHLQEILCDADLDYLGREDYGPISTSLYQEMSHYRALSEEEWLHLQIHFLEQHHYFTAYSRAKNQANKEARLLSLKNKINL